MLGKSGRNLVEALEMMNARTAMQQQPGGSATGTASAGSERVLDAGRFGTGGIVRVQPVLDAGRFGTGGTVRVQPVLDVGRLRVEPNTQDGYLQQSTRWRRKVA